MLAPKPILELYDPIRRIGTPNIGLVANIGAGKHGMSPESESEP